MPIFRDIKHRDARRILTLKKEGEHQPIKKISADNFLDLTNKKKVTRARVAREVQDEHVFVAQKQQDETPKKSYKDLIQMVVFGLAILFVANIVHIGSQLFTIASDVEADAFQGYEYFVDGGKDAMNANFGSAVQYFEAASNAFAKAQEKVWFLGNQKLIETKQSIGDSAYSLLESGEHLSNAASYFSQGVSGLQEIPVLFLEYNTHADEKQNTSKKSLTEKLKSSLTLFNYAFDELILAQEKINKAGPLMLPENLREHFDMLSTQLDELVVTVREVQERIPAILTMLGDRYPHRYLVLLQNNTESRPTGGFIGSYMIVDVNDGYVEKTEFHDIYENDGQLHEFIEAPDEIAALTDNWRMRDSNYSPDFSLSAAKAAWFLEKEEGPGVDSVIVVNQSILADLLSLTGPIEAPGLSAPLTAENYNTVLTYIIESKLEGEDSPKDVIGRIIPQLQSKIYDSASFKSLFTVVQQGIKEKYIMGWSKDENVQNFFHDIGMSGEVERTREGQDYFSLVSINVGGNKSDLYMDTEVLHETSIDKSGEMTDKVTITRKHTWNPNTVLEWEKELKPFGYTDMPDWLQNILGKGTNKSVIKLYLPPGVELEETIGIEKDQITVGYDEELDKTFFYFTNEVAAQNESVITLSYKLPKTLHLASADEYRITVQKQPGAIKNVRFIKRVIPDPRISNYRNYPDEVVFAQGEVIEYETILNTDQHFASLWGIE